MGVLPVCMSLYPSKTEGIESPRFGVTDSWESSVGARNQTWVPWKSSQYS